MPGSVHGSLKAHEPNLGHPPEAPIKKGETKPPESPPLEQGGIHNSEKPKEPLLKDHEKEQGSDASSEFDSDEVINAERQAFEQNSKASGNDKPDGAVQSATKLDEETKQWLGTIPKSGRQTLSEQLGREATQYTQIQTQHQTELRSLGARQEGEHPERTTRRSFLEADLVKVDEILGGLGKKIRVLNDAISKDRGWMERSASSGAFQWITGVGGLLTGVVFLPQAFQGMSRPKDGDAGPPPDMSQGAGAASAMQAPMPSMAQPQAAAQPMIQPQMAQTAAAPPSPNPYAGLYSPYTGQAM